MPNLPLFCKSSTLLAFHPSFETCKFVNISFSENWGIDSEASGIWGNGEQKKTGVGGEEVGIEKTINGFAGDSTLISALDHLYITNLGGLFWKISLQFLFSCLGCL